MAGQIADDEDRASSEREAAPLAPLVWITAAVSAAAVAPLWLMLPVAAWPFAGVAFTLLAPVVGAIAASLAGVPLLKLALSFGWRRWWQLALVGVFAAWLSLPVGAMVLSLLRPESGILANVLRTPSAYWWALAQSPALWFVTPIGAAAGVSYWALYLARQEWVAVRPGRVFAAAALGATLINGVGVQACVQFAKDRAARRAAFQAARVPSDTRPPTGASMFAQLRRVAAANSADVRLVSDRWPGCALVITSPELAAATAIDQTLTVDLLDDARGTPNARIQIMRVGTLNDPNLFRIVGIDSCRPWR